MNTTGNAPALRCACLVAVEGGRLLLVRVRQNAHWCLPGGKIEAGESPVQALQRELAEELGIALLPESIRPLYTVTGPAYGQPGEVELVCFSARWQGGIRAQQEISAVDWLPVTALAQFAPAVQQLCREHLLAA
ncbi:MAG: hydrolase [Candidatus Dactylopiibacterium carminicum]|uniref:Hydrolase n=1 Tax=Candidatus Dactylopiibacterium carminicum TaxID=857335 RepID=A0A272EVL1_9RHOO|nr:NUDIX domain-containing protein [Candidatus Dactylopiibacterium carminicum]KAF7599908.1 NUDIX domain-containing protein [Candidatus Dactylopiibacterium carminicum]PAS94153.1 MAG: hydrolase [Candidatus Dactylopiibacterium carminicum]PAS96777.1 MAG: hydrolase [Candidatus Dactylopiibacterium carminicum]PAS99910.1 MAG: hypothetical protein BSR46_05555 [Candidatus Dactylopiibacterium carminicum]